MTMSEHPTFSRLQDEAIEISPMIQRNEAYEAFLDSLTQNQRMAMIFGNLIGQVCNGGFDQWIGNTYCGSDSKLLLRYLKMLDTPTAKRVAEMVVIAGEWAEEPEYSRRNDQDEDDRENALHALDTEFYLKTVGDQLEDEIEAFLSARENQNATA